MVAVQRVKVYMVDDGTGWSITVTERQVDILQLLADGKGWKDVVNEVFISRHTFKRELDELFQKMGAENRTHAVAKALRAELIR